MGSGGEARRVEEEALPKKVHLWRWPVVSWHHQESMKSGAQFIRLWQVTRSIVGPDLTRLLRLSSIMLGPFLIVGTFTALSRHRDFLVAGGVPGEDPEGTWGWFQALAPGLLLVHFALCVVPFPKAFCRRASAAAGIALGYVLVTAYFVVSFALSWDSKLWPAMVLMMFYAVAPLGILLFNWPVSGDGMRRLARDPHSRCRGLLFFLSHRAR